MKIIVFLGPDGTGKSTIIDLLCNELIKKGEVITIHFKPFIFQKRKKATTTPYNKQSYGIIFSFIRVFSWLIEYYLWFVYSIIFGREKIVIFDRFLYDIQIDPKRYRVAKIISKIPIFYLIFPKPVMTFYLDTDPEIIFKRKQEVSFSEIQQQVNNYRKYILKKDIVKINSNNSPNFVVQQILNKLDEKI